MTDITKRAGQYGIQAVELITGERARTHGDFILQHDRAAMMIQAYLKAKYGLDVPLRASDVLQMLIAVKDSRDMTGAFNDDNGRDRIGYALLLAVAREVEATEPKR